MPSYSSNQSGGTATTTYTGGYAQGPASSYNITRYASTSNTTEEFYNTGKVTPRGYIQQAVSLATWERDFQAAGRRR